MSRLRRVSYELVREIYYQKAREEEAQRRYRRKLRRVAKMKLDEHIFLGNLGIIISSAILANGIVQIIQFYSGGAF